MLLSVKEKEISSLKSNIKKRSKSRTRWSSSWNKSKLKRRVSNQDKKKDLNSWALENYRLKKRNLRPHSLTRWKCLYKENPKLNLSVTLKAQSDIEFSLMTTSSVPSNSMDLASRTIRVSLDLIRTTITVWSPEWSYLRENRKRPWVRKTPLWTTAIILAQ